MTNYYKDIVNEYIVGFGTNGNGNATCNDYSGVGDWIDGAWW